MKVSGITLPFSLNLVGSSITTIGYAADMREFSFKLSDSDINSPQKEVSLHVQCPWRIESSKSVITGSFDWYEPADPSLDMGDDWDPATGGSLQELRLRELFHCQNDTERVIYNRTSDFIVTEVRSTHFGDLEIDLDGSLKLILFASGSRGEFWRLFLTENLSAHYVCEGTGK